MNLKRILFFILCIFLRSVSSSGEALAGDYSNSSRTIQFDVKSLLNARMVTTWSNGTLVCWNKGVDGTWSGLATRSAADLMGSKDKVALPNSGTFEANAFHPKVVLNFSDADGTGNQVRFTDKNVADSYSFPVAPNEYSNLSLFFMSAFGSSDITVEISYSDKTSETKKYTIIDWAWRIDESETKYFLAANMAKWGNAYTELEKDSHYLMGINIQPDSSKKVVKITVSKPVSETTLSFWGATGYGIVSPSWSVLGNAPEISYEGRTVVTSEGSVKMGYPGIVTRVSFRGTDLSMATRTSSDELYLDVIVDDGTPVFLKVPKGESSVVLAKGLKTWEHKVAIHKRVESAVGILEVVSMKVSGEFLSPPELPSRKLLFMGDSFTAGQATTVEDGGPMDPSKAMRQNARLSYPRLLADKLNAQCHIIAYAGRGIVRDWQGLNNVRCAPEYYENALPDDITTRWNPSKYVPDAIGLCLGNNDFGVGVPDQVEYVRAFAQFVMKLRHDAPDAQIFLITSPSLTDEPGKVPMRTVQKAYLDEVVQRLGDPKIQVVQLAHYEGVPGDFHPSGTAHRAVANELEPILRKTLNW
jgi:lysophospholipase L1-like esterase